MIKILWLSPSFNHYKARFLNHLANEKDLDLTILAGKGRINQGDAQLNSDWKFKLESVDVLKKDFGKSKRVTQYLKQHIHEYDWVLIPAEKKNFILFLYLLFIRKKKHKVRLFSYNHLQTKSSNGINGKLDQFISKFYYKFLDKVIFYTKHSCEIAVKNNLINRSKAFAANNTVDETEIEKYYTYSLPDCNKPTILFIGRLIPSKRIKDLLNYYLELKNKIPNLSLEIIGDGPDNDIVKEMCQSDPTIIWHGTIVDEEKIAPIMKRSTCIFIPGLSGLSVNHAFAYGRPYITLKSNKHGPEISYLTHGLDGLYLDDNSEIVLKELENLLKSPIKINRMSEMAYQKSKELSVNKWVKDFKSSLLE